MAIKGDLKSFSRRIKVRAGKINRNTDDLVRKVILTVDQAVVVSTPVDTGRARANWRPSLHTPILATLAEPSNPSQGMGQALAAAQQVAQMYRGGVRSPVVHITNSLPYIQYLNQGSSQQAPRNFVSTAILVAVQAVRGARIISVR